MGLGWLVIGHFFVLLDHCVFFFLPIIKQSNPRNKISMIRFVCFGTRRQVRPFEVFSECYAFGMYYDACKIFIADVKCIIKTSFLQSFGSLGD